jgi:S1-C subfamily serine protease
MKLPLYLLSLCLTVLAHAQSPSSDQSKPSTPAQPAASKLDAAAIYERILPSVVVINTAKSNGLHVGSGVLVRADGMIATNYHVIRGATAAQVRLKNGDVYDDVAVLDVDERRDLALIKIKAINLPTVQFADSDGIKIGSPVFAIGSPVGLEWSISSGIVSALRRSEEVDPSLTGFRIIQFTAPVSPGNSGGPLLDEHARLIGVVCWSLESGNSLYIGIPSNYLAPMVTSANTEGRSLSKMPAPPIARAVNGKASPSARVVRTPAQAVKAAQTICVLLVEGSAQMKVEFNAKLQKWGKLRLVSTPEEADLVLEIVQTGAFDYYQPGSAASGAALLRDPQSDTEIWAAKKGGYWSFSGWSPAKVARQIADDLIKFLNTHLP